MANRRMFSKEVTNSDQFLDMPLSSQALYFHLGMNADDDGFVQPKSIMRLVQAKDGDLGVLLDRGFVIPFANSIIVITHRKTNNEIKSDRKKPTIYQEHIKALGLENGVYKLETKCIQNVSNLDTQDSIGKDRLDKDSIGEERKGEILSNDNTPDGDQDEGFGNKEINQIIEIMKQACSDAGLQYMAGYKERQFAKHILSKKLAAEIEKYGMPLEEFVANIIKLSAQPYMKPVNTPQLFYQNWGHVINASISQKKGSTTTFAYI